MSGSVQLNAKTGETVQLRLQLVTGDVSKFPQATVYNSAGALVDTVPLTHVALGFYSGAHTAGAASAYGVVYIVYTDSGHTTEDTTFERVMDVLKVLTIDLDDLSADIKRSLGITHDNVFEDNHVHAGPGGELTAMRLRAFANATDAGNATQGGTPGGGDPVPTGEWNFTFAYSAPGAISELRTQRVI